MASVFPQGFGASSVSDSLREDLISEAFNTQGRNNNEPPRDKLAQSSDNYDTSYG